MKITRQTQLATLLILYFIGSGFCTSKEPSNEYHVSRSSFRYEYDDSHCCMYRKNGETIKKCCQSDKTEPCCEGVEFPGWNGDSLFNNLFQMKNGFGDLDFNISPKDNDHNSGFDSLHERVKNYVDNIKSSEIGNDNDMNQLDDFTSLKEMILALDLNGIFSEKKQRENQDGQESVLPKSIISKIDDFKEVLEATSENNGFDDQDFKILKPKNEITKKNVDHVVLMPKLNEVDKKSEELNLNNKKPEENKEKSIRSEESELTKNQEKLLDNFFSEDLFSEKFPFENILNQMITEIQDSHTIDEANDGEFSEKNEISKNADPRIKKSVKRKETPISIDSDGDGKKDTFGKIVESEVVESFSDFSKHKDDENSGNSIKASSVKKVNKKNVRMSKKSYIAQDSKSTENDFE